MPTNTTKLSKTFVYEILIAALIVVLPFTIYAHLWFSEEPSKSIGIFGYEYYHGYPDLNTFVWYLIFKTIPFLLFLIWFYSISYKWRYFILIPINLYLYSLCLSLLYFSKFYMVCLNVYILLIVLVYDSYKNLILKKNKLSLLWLLNSTNTKEFYKHVLNQLNVIQHINIVTTKEDYLKELFQIKDGIVSKLITFNGFNKNRKLNLITKKIIVFVLVLVIPILFFFSKLIPIEIVEYDLGWMRIQNFGFQNVKFFIWFLNLKICFLIPLCIWFITCEYWWKYALFSPILLTIYQIQSVFKDSDLVDETEFIQAVPWVLVVIALLVFISNLVNYKNQIENLLVEVTDEIEEILVSSSVENTTIAESKKQLNALKNNSENTTASEKLQALERLKKELLKQLD